MSALSLYLLLAATPQVMSGPIEYEVIPEESVFALGTHKAGFASGLAHNHLIVASGYSVRLAFDAADPSRTSFQIRLSAAELMVDDAVIKDRWYPRLSELDVWGDSYRGISDEDREDVRTNMLDETQLYADSFPTIEVRSTTIEARGAERGDTHFSYEVLLAVTIRGETVHRPFVARYAIDDKALILEALGVFYFTDFGIEPYSKFLGSVRNKNEFHLYLYLRALPL
ncbi:MAG: YceI family protein [Gemmatimonadetes bacterium]|nr:YceI family protein [Gemmatimonadota bacterium]MDA1104382.1 YceI family protein [Gemmatimonadota bacterium]